MIVNGFWDEVVAWSREHGMQLDNDEKIHSVQNRQLRALVWLSHRTLPTGETVGLPEAVMYEKAGGQTIFGYVYIDVVLQAARSRDT